MPQIVGSRSTYMASSGQENTLVRQVDDQITLLEPNETPLVTFLMKMKKRFPIYVPKYEWLEDDFVGRWATVNDAAAGGAGRGAIADATSTLTMSDGTLFVAGDLFCFPTGTSDMHEVCLVTAVAGNDVTFTRGWGSTTKIAVANGAAIRILGSAAAEGADVPESKSTQMVTKVSYAQIFRTAVKLSKTQVASKLYGRPGGERKREQKKALIAHKQKLNSAALWGAAAESNLSTGPLRTTMGLNSVVQSNVSNIANLTKKGFEEFARKAFRYGKQQKLLLASPIIISAIHDFGNSFLLISPSEKVLGVDIERVQTGHGTFLLARDWMLEDGVAGKPGFGGMAFAIDLDECAYFYLNGNGESRDTRILEDVVKTGKDAYVDEVLTEGGFSFKFEKKHAKLTGVTDYTA